MDESFLGLLLTRALSGTGALLLLAVVWIICWLAGKEDEK